MPAVNIATIFDPIAGGRNEFIKFLKNNSLLLLKSSYKQQKRGHNSFM